MTDEETTLQDLQGLVATVVLTGKITPQFQEAREQMRVYNERQGFRNVEYRNFNAQLVEAGRDAVVRHALSEDYDYILQIDADATFPQETMLRLLETAYGRVPHSDVVGAYAQLKSEPYLPTIDSGSGRWEEWYPKSDVIEVIRTGCHCLLTKQQAFGRFGPPWFRTREADRPVDALAEVDGFARRKLDGRNPLTEHPEWGTLVAEARGVAQNEEDRRRSNVGEDSGFCDRLAAAGGRLFVDTEVVTGHITQKEVTWQDHKEAMEEQEEQLDAVCGVRR